MALSESLSGGVVQVMDVSQAKQLPKLRFIEAMLLKHGHLHRAHVQRAFDFQTARASQLIKLYLTLNPGAMALDHSTKTYRPCDGFKPAFLHVDPQAYLDAAQVMAVEQIIQIRQVVC
ncbi:hypothetical protein ABKY47_002069 [Aeromonas hydrophila]